MEIKKLTADEVSDFKRLIEIFKDVFENDVDIPPVDHLRRLLSNPDFMVFVALSGGNVAGGLTIYVLHRYYSVKPEAYIYDLGISPEFQRKGLGKALMAEVCRYCQANGFENAYVEAEHDDVEAVRFYRATAYNHEVHAVHFTYVWR